MNQTETQGNNQPKNARRSSTDISMPDYVPMETGDQLATPTEQPFLLVGMRQEEEDPSSNLRVPENTSIANGQGGNEHDAVLVPLLSSSIPSELANSLTHSLLNQPMPLHFQQPNFHMPAGEIKSRKENRRQKPITDQSMPALVPGSSTASLEHQEMRRVSQQMHVSSSSSVPNCRASSRLNSPRTQDCTERQSQRAVSMGVEVKNTPSKFNSQISSTFEKGTKRSRTFTPASVRAIDLNEEPRRDSPGARLTPLVSELDAMEKK